MAASHADGRPAPAGKLIGIGILMIGVVLGSMLVGGMGTWWTFGLAMAFMLVGMRMIDRHDALVDAAEAKAGRKTAG